MWKILDDFATVQGEAQTVRLSCVQVMAECTSKCLFCVAAPVTQTVMGKNRELDISHGLMSAFSFKFFPSAPGFP